MTRKDLLRSHKLLNELSRATRITKKRKPVKANMVNYAEEANESAGTDSTEEVIPIKKSRKISFIQTDKNKKAIVTNG